jgi:large subunit ribosomal protein L18
MTNNNQKDKRNIKVSVHRSNKNVSALVFDMSKGITLATFSSNNSGESKSQKSILIGEKVAQFLKKNNITGVIFDRKDYRYHGRVKQIAESIRANGITI